MAAVCHSPHARAGSSHLSRAYTGPGAQQGWTVIQWELHLIGVRQLLLGVQSRAGMVYIHPAAKPLEVTGPQMLSLIAVALWPPVLTFRICPRSLEALLRSAAATSSKAVILILL